MFKFFTPFRVLFYLDGSKIAAQPKQFVEFLTKASAALADPNTALGRKTHPALDIQFNLLKKAEAKKSEDAKDIGRSFLSPQVFTLRFRESFRGELEKIYARAAAEADATVEKYSQMLKPDLGSVEMRFNDNTVAIMRLDLDLVAANRVAGRDAWNRLNDWAKALKSAMMRELYPAMIYPLLKGLNEFSGQTRDRFVNDISEYKIFFVLVGDPQNPYPDMDRRFIAMKTNITYCVAPEYEKNRWTENILRPGTSVRLKEAEIHMSDENNLVVMHPGLDMGCLEVLWDLLPSAAYYYIAMNVINVNLIRYIGITSDKHSTQALRVIGRDMERIINSVTILKVRYNDLASELNGVAKKIFQSLQKEWDFRNITENMQYKLELCRTNIQILSVETQRRNQGRIETVLTGVAGMTILSVFVELGSYATQMPDDHRYMVGSIPGFMDLGFLLSGNTLSWIGIVMAVSVLLFTIKHRSG